MSLLINNIPSPLHLLATILGNTGEKSANDTWGAVHASMG